MALEKDTFSVSLATGVNEKTDEVVAGPEQMAIVKDGVVNKEGRFQKRYGQSVKSTTVQTSISSPPTIGTATAKTTTFSHENQLCMINNGAFYSQVSGQNAWALKGYAANVGVSVSAIAGGTQFFDVVSVSGITAAITSTSLLVIEEATGTVLSTTSGSNYLRLIAFGNAIWLVSFSGTNLLAQQVSLTTGALGGSVTLRTDYSSIYDARAISVAVTTGSVVGEMAFIAYTNTAPTVIVTPMDATGTVPALGSLNTGMSQATSISICLETAVSPNRFFVSINAPSSFPANPQGGVIYSASWTFSTSAYTLSFGPAGVWTYQTTGAYDRIYNVTSAIDPTNSSLYVFWDIFSPGNSSTLSHSADGSIYYANVSFGGGVTVGGTVYARGLMLAGIPLRDSGRSTIYLPCMFYSPLQSTMLLMDVLKGVTSGIGAYAVAMCLNGLAGLPLALPKLRIKTGTKYRTVNNGYLIDFDLGPAYAQSSQYMAKTTHLTGGLLWAYDGQSLVEHNFLIGPEIFKVYTQAAWAVATVTQVGGASAKESLYFTFLPACAIPAGGYIEFSIWPNISAAVTYVIWFKVDGNGSAPSVPGATIIECDVSSATDTAEDVAFKAWVAWGSSPSRSTFSDNKLTFVSAVNGTVPVSPSVSGTTVGSASAGGTWSYTFCYKWTDRNGQVYRSLPAVNANVVVTANQYVFLELWAPHITNKTATDVRVEIYRSQTNSTELQLINTSNVAAFCLNQTLTMSATAARIMGYDGATDASINANTILYTNDGTMENFNIGACTAISAFKNRLVVTSVDDQTASFYSRTNVVGEPVNFSKFNAVRLDQDGQVVTAHIQMDDKLCMWKNSSIWVTAGDGSNDLGQNETFSLPMRLPGDYGTSNPNSLILSPIGVMFQTPSKGIQVLGRDLSVQYIGAGVDDYKSNVVSSVVMTTNYENIVFSLQDSTTSLVYNYRFNRWDFWTNQQADSACLWQGAYTRAKNNGKVYVESTNFYDVDGSNQSISMYLETVWLKVKMLQSCARIYSLMLLGQYLSPHTITVQLGFDFDPTLANYETHTFNAATVIGSGGTSPDDQTYQVEINPARQKCNAIKIKITETPGAGSQQSAYFNALDFYVGLKAGLNKVKAQKSI